MRMLLFALLSTLGLYGQSDLTRNNLKALECIKKIDTIENPVADRIAIDVKNIKEVLNRLPDVNPTIMGYKAAFPMIADENKNINSTSVCLPDNLEFTKYEIDGGYGSLDLKLLTSKGNILTSTVVINCNVGVYKEYCLKNVEVPLQCFLGKLVYKKEHIENINLYKKDYPNFIINLDIGSNEKISTEDYAFYALNDPSAVDKEGQEYHVYNDYINFAQLVFSQLVKERRYSVIEKLLFSVNPVARMYAYSALDAARIKKGYKASKIYKKQMKVIASDGLTFLGGIISCWPQKFSYDEYDFSKKNPFLN